MAYRKHVLFAFAAIQQRFAVADDVIREVAEPALCGEGEARQYSGRLPAGTDDYFYFLTESRSVTPSADPLVLWMTGGPGCSSILAALTENGPCQVGGRRDGKWEMLRRQYSWVDVANVVWVDQPGGVGFSSRPAAAGLTHNENEVAENMYGFLESFYSKFPQYASVPFFIFGESYGGHYVPAVASRVLHGIQHQGFGARLEGVGIGNGLVSPAEQFPSKPVMAYNGGGKTGSLHSGFVNVTEFKDMEAALPKCEALMHKCQQAEKHQMWPCLSAYMFCSMTELAPVKWSHLNPYDLRRPCEVEPMCYNESLTTEYLNDPKVQKALGFEQFRPWAACNQTVNIPFVTSGDFFRDLRPQVIELLAAGVGVLVYNGDDDFMCDWVGSKWWMENLHWPHGKEWAHTPDEQLLMDGQDHGRVRSAANFTFVQIYKAGHMVPMDQPKVSVEMVRQFIRPGSPWRSGTTALAATHLSSTAPHASAQVATVALAALLMMMVAFAWRTMSARRRVNLDDEKAQTYYRTCIINAWRSRIGPEIAVSVSTQ